MIESDLVYLSVNSKISFGRICIINTGVPIDNISDRFKAKESIESLSKDFGISGHLIASALKEFGSMSEDDINKLEKTKELKV